MANASKFLEEIEKLKKKKKEQGEDTSSLEPIAPVKPDLSFSPQVNSFFEALNTEQEKLRRREEIANSYDIAPTVGSVSGTKHGGGGGSFTVKSEEDDSLLDFFDKGAFREGVSLKTIGQAILGTAGDIGIGAVKGVAKTGGGLIDAAQYGAAAVADAFGADEWADDVRKSAQRTVIDDAFAPVDDYLDKYSVLGRTLNSATEAVGQIGAILATGGLAGALGAGAVGASAATMGVMGLSSFGSSTGEAYKGGAETGEAELYGAIAGTADAITELLSGGLGKGVKAVGLSHGLGGLDDIVAKKVSEKITNTIAKNAVQFGVKASGEGLEEVLAGTAQAVGKKLTYMEEEELSQIIADENLLEQFVVGAMASGVAQVPSVAQANKSGTDYVTGRTKNEQAVIDRVVEQRIKDAETDAGGVKLNPKQRQEIEEQVVSDMERGRIEVETIEEVLGGEEYRTYRAEVEKEDALRKEYEELGALKEPTLAERTRYEELHAKASEFSSDERRTALKKKLSEHVAVVAQEDRLSESYAERARRKEYFTEDVTKYKSDAAKKTVQNLVDAKLANNTGRTHDMVETVAKIAEDKGIVFNFTNNQKLRESGKMDAVAAGVTINGYKDADGITINLDSPKAWDFIVGHEVTHALEGTAEYTALADAVKVYAQTKGEYDSRKTAITSLYAEGTDVDSELTADMVGEYLFTDEQFVTELSTKHQNVFQKVFAEIKHLVKMVTAGSKEARQLEQVKRTFEKAYRAAQETQGDAVQNSLTADTQGRELTSEQREYFRESKVTDENGNLKVMYHGTPHGGFHVFDPDVSDDGTSLFFTDSNEVASSYSGTEETYAARTFRTADDFNVFFEEIGAREYSAAEEMHGNHRWFVLYEDGTEIASSETADGLYEEFRDWSGLGEGAVNYEVYLNLTNPLEVDAEGRDWNMLPGVDDNAARYDYIKVVSVNDDRTVTVEYAMTGDAAPVTETVVLEDRFGGSLAETLANMAPGEQIDGADANPATTREYAKYAKEHGYDGVIISNIQDNGGYGSAQDVSTVAIAFDAAQVKSAANQMPTGDSDIRFSLSVSEIDGTTIDAARYSSNEADNQYSLSHSKEIAAGQADYRAAHSANVAVSAAELAEAQRVTAAMVDVMMQHSSILPEDKIGKVLTKNGSYDRSVENTTICVRTLAYNEFVDKVQEQIGRPLTQMESFLVSQKLYDIATDPQCLYCYVSLDRKSYNEMLLRYMQDRDTVIDKYNKSDKLPATVDALYQEFLNGRKDTKNMKDRFAKWISYADDGVQMLSLADIATEDRQRTIQADGGMLAEQLKDARAYAQSASWSKIQKDYVAYRDEILKLGDRVVKNLNEHYGMRWYSFSDYSAAFIVENMQQITDASLRGLKGLSYTKDTDYAEIFAPTGMNINISVFVKKDANGNYYIDERQSANIEKAMELRDRYPNVGIVATVTDDDALRWAGEQEWTDVIIPFHIVRTGTDVAEYYKWLNYTAESADSISDGNLWEAYVDSLHPKNDAARKKVSKNIYPSEHQNNRDTYLNLCQSRGLTPRFARFAGEDWYMKLVNETRLSAGETSPLKPIFNEQAAKDSFTKFVEKGGYEGGWYRDGVDVDAEVRAVADDVLAGKQANEVAYGRQDGIAPADILARRRANRTHGQHSLSDANAPVGGRGVAARDLLYQGEDIAPVAQAADQIADDGNMVQTADRFADSGKMMPIPGEHSEIDRLNAEYDAARAEFDTLSADVQSRYAEMTPAEQEQAMADVLAAGDKLKAAQDALNGEQQSVLASYTDADVPPEMDAPYYGEEDALPMPDDPMADRDEKEVGNRSVKAYQYLNPEVKPYFREEANAMLGDLRRATRGERFVTWDTAGNEAKWTGVERTLAYDLAGLKDRFGYSYEQLEKGIQAIIDDHGAENNAVSKRIELLIHDRLAKGYVDAYSGIEIPANEEYLDFLREKQITEYNDANFDALMVDAESLIPPAEDVDDVAPVMETGRVQEAAFDVDAPIFEDVDDMDGGETIAAEIPQEEDAATEDGHIRTVRERLEAKLRNFETELENNKRLRVEASAEYDRQIAELETAYEALPNKATKKANAMQRRIERLVRFKGNNDADYAKRIFDLEERVAKVSAEIKSGESPTEQANMRRELHAGIVENIRNNFEVRGYDMDEVFKGAKNLATFSTVDNTPQRVMEKALGYKQGQILADLTVNKTAQHETEGIRWLNQFTDRKKGLLAQISRQYNIKPGSKESAAAQMYAEGFYVSKHDEIIKYGDAELAADFPDAKVQARIKGLARDGRIRAIYDATLDAINESRVRNAYPAIQKLDNYFLHFRAMEDTFSRIGLPFNPNDIRAMDLPTDLNGVTADLKPGQPYFASAQHRRGKRTSFDLLGGLEKYLSSAKNQIYHIDDIQTLRALRNQIVDTYGQSKGLQSLDELTEEEVQERIKEVFGSHLSTFASFLNEEANHIAGKKALIDRGLEGMLGRRALTFMSDLNRQVGSNMVGYNISSALTNFIAPVQAFAKMNKGAFVKGFAQTVSNRIGGIFGRGDTFAEDSSVMVRREGEQRFHRTAWQKMSDPGYALMGAIDSISTEIVARAKYNELTAKGMTSEQAHYETDKYVSRLMGDRSLGQQPLLFNSKTLGMITKFQLEVRNQMDAQFYDTVKEAEVSTENIENAAKRNAVKAAKITSTFVQLAVAQHLFGKVFESIAGYNPTFDIIEAIVKAAGWDDDEDDDDTVLDNLEQGVLSLLEDLPYSSVLTGGRVPIESALPIAQFVKGKDSYGNDKSRLETLGEAAPYYVLPGGYGQIKKTAAGLGMYSDEHPVAGSYTDSGNLRFPVGTEPLDVAQAAVFGQWSPGNARDYFDNERKPLSPKQVDEYAAADMTIQDYWRYRDGLKEHDNLAAQAEYINSLDIPTWKKNLFINNLTDRKEDIDMADYGKYGSLAEMDFAKKSPEKYALMKEQGVTYEQYQTFDDDTKNAYEWAAKSPEKYGFIRDIGYTLDDYAKATDTEKDAFTWAYNNPDKYLVSRAVSDDLFAYRGYADALNDIKADKDSEGKSISGSRKDKVIDYINGLDLDYGAKIILLKQEYPAEDAYNYDIIDYLNERDDISGDDMVVMLTALGFKVSDDGTVTWD